ncbi:TPA: PcfJ domain-containing protein [Enterococcus faecium]
MSSINLNHLFEDINHHFQQFSIEDNEELMRLFQIEKEYDYLTFICREGRIIDPKESKIISHLRRFKNYISKNKETISEIKFDGTTNLEYLVRVTYQRNHRLIEDDQGVLIYGGEEYDCLKFIQLKFESIGRSIYLESRPFYIRYNDSQHLFLQDEPNGFTILERRGKKQMTLSYERSLTFMDCSCESIFQKINPFIKEMMKEKDSLPFTWVEIIESKNKYELLCKKYPSKKFTKKVNKYPLRYTYALLKLRPRVTSKQFRKIEAAIEQKDNDLFPSEIFMCARKNSREFVKFLLVSYVQNCILSNFATIILSDLIDMSFSLNQKLEFNFKTERGLSRQHNQIVEEYNLKQAKKIKTFKLKQHGKYKLLIRHLQSHPHFTLIKTNKELFIEGSTMHHCVYSYLNKIQKGGSIIWKYERQDYRYTVEIEKRKYGNYEVVQCYGKYDSLPDKQELNEIKKIVRTIPYK